MLARTRCLALVGLCILAMVIEINGADLNRNLARRRRRETKFEADGKFKCPQPSAAGKEDAPAIGAADKFERFPLEASAVVEWKDATWKYKAGFHNIKDGSDAAGTEMAPADFCKMNPTFCTGAKPAFCSIDAVKNANICCPLMARPAPKGSACDAKGVPRAWMPQVITGADGMKTNYGKLEAWAKGDGGMGADFKISGSVGLVMNGKKLVDGKTEGDYTGGQKEIDVAAMSPSQDEILLGNSFPKLCNKKGERTPVPFFAPFMSADGYIIDGHHRWSQIKACSFLDPTTACPAAVPAKLNIVQASVNIDVFLIKVVKAAIAAWAGPPAPGAKKTSLGDTTEFIAPGFLEIDAQFGRNQHQSLAEAAHAFAVLTRDRMAEAGLELKGGLEAHKEMFHVFHAERLGWN